MVNLPNLSRDFDSHTPNLLDLFISSDPNICHAVAFRLFGKYRHVVVLDCVNFPLTWVPFLISLFLIILVFSSIIQET